MPLALPRLTGIRLTIRRALALGACVCLVATALTVFGPTLSSASNNSEPQRRETATSADARARALETYGRLPLRFEANRGQTGGGVRFLSRGSGYTLFLTDGGAVLRLRGTAEEAPGVTTLKVKLDGARPSSRVEGVGPLPGQSNYFVGDRRQSWRTEVPAYEKVRYSSVYPGVDLIYYGNQGRLEYDFHLAPGADPRRIGLNFEGASSVRLDEQGDLMLGTESGDVRQLKPVAYQEIGGARVEVEASYAVGKDGRVGFRVGNYDPAHPLVIDPVLIYSTYLGGANVEQGLAVAVDAAGSAYVAGSTGTISFPGPSPIQTNHGGFNDAFVLKLSPDGTSLIYATYIGGAGDDFANAIAVDAAGNAYVAGSTGSGGFPRTSGAWQQSKDDGLDGFLAKLNPTGTELVYSTFLGGAGSDQVFGLDVDASGRAYVTGRTDSTTFRTLPPGLRSGNAIQKSTNGAGNWTPSDAGLAAATVNGFAVVATDANVIYAATSFGVYKSTDGGGNWQLTGVARPSTAPISTSAVAVDPSNPSVVYAAASNGVYKSTDGGNLYELKTTGFAIPFIIAIVVNPTSPSTLYAGTSFGIYRSTNGGESWSEVRNGITGTSPRVNRIAFDPSNSSIIYAATTRGMFKTTDSAANWTAINNGLTINTFIPQVLALAIDPVTPSTLYVSTNTGPSSIYKSTDGGANWVNTGGISVTIGGLSTSPLVNTLVIDPSAPTTLYAGTSIGTGVFKSTDSGASWFATNTGLTSKTVLALALAPNNPATLYAGAAAGGDAFVARFNAAGSFPEYVKFVGGSENEEGRGIVADAAGNAYVTGSTASENFPVANAAQPASGGFNDAFVLKLDASGNTFLYSTFLGGAGTEQGRAIDVNAAGNAFVTGSTNASNFPVVNALKPQHPSFDTDAFVSKLDASGSSLVYSTYLGGAATDQGFSIAVDAADNAYVAGATTGSDFPVVNPVQAAFGGVTDAFVTKLNAAGSNVLYSTFLGGFSSDQANALALDAAGGVYVVGNTSSNNFPLVNPLKPAFDNSADAFISKIGPSFELSLTMTDAPDPVPFGSDLTYTLVVTNNGELPADGVTLTDTLPAGATLVSANAGQGSCSGNASVICNLGTLGAGTSVTVTLVVKPPAVRNITNTASVAANAADPVPANNSATATTQVNFAELSVTAATSYNKVAPGGRVNYLLRLANNSGGPADSVTLTHTLPAGTTFVSCSPLSGTCGGSGNTRTVTFPTLAVGQAVSIVIVASVDAGVAEGTTLSATTTVTSLTPDPNTGNNTATTDASVTATPLRKRENGARIAFGGGPVYTTKADGSETPVQLPGSPNTSIFPRWSPDGTRLAYMGTRTNPDYPYNNTSRIEVVNADGSGLTVLADNSIDYSFNNRSAFSWSPDGTRIAYVGSDRFIYLANADGSGYAKLPGSPEQVKDIDWSPDGSRFLFAKDFGEIYVMNVDGSGLTKLVPLGTGPDGPTHYTSPVWSPDMTQILFVQRSNNYTDIFVMNSDGTGRQRFLNRAGTSAPGWSPDGTKVVYYNSTDVRVVDYSGGNDVLLAGGQTCCDFGATSWQPVPTNTPLPTPTPRPPTYSLKGNVAIQNNGFLAQGQLRLEGPISTTIFFGGGAYEFVRLPPGQYTVTPSSVSHTISPESRTVTITNADATGVDFAATFVPANITGRITDSNGAPLAGIRVSSFGGFPEGTTFTDANGFYSFANVQRFRNYSISPDPFTPYTFEPQGRFIQNLTASTEVNFVGTRQPTYVIRGRAVDAATGQGIGGIQINLAQDGTAVTQTFTDFQGNFTFGERKAGRQYGVYATFTQTYLFDPKADAPNPFGQIIIPSLTSEANVTFIGTRQNTVQFSSTASSVAESAGQVVLTVTRTGETSLPATVNYSTTDGSASEKSDYTAALGTIQFGAGETSKTVTVFITDDAFVESTQTFALYLDGTVGTRLGESYFTNVSIQDNDLVPSTANPIDNTGFFVRQHYRDFLNRDPDASGLQFWINEIEQCGADAGCREVKRINVSAAFFLSIEFQETGYLAYRFYKAAYGDATSPNVTGTVPVVRLREFLADGGKIGAGVQVGVGDWQRRLDENKAAYASEFVARTRFRTEFPSGMTAEEFVTKLDGRAGGVLSADERAQLVALLGQTPADEQKRAQVIRRVAEDADLRQRETNRAFVLMQYFGYMRRNANDPQDTDFRGWKFWLDKLEEFHGDFVQAEMVKAFITSDEYRKRFGQ